MSFSSYVKVCENISASLQLKHSHYTPWRWLWERRYSSYSFLTLALDGGVSGLRHALAALLPRKKDPRYPLYRRLGGPQSWSGYRGYSENPFCLCSESNLDRTVVQSAVRYFTEWVNLASSASLTHLFSNISKTIQNKTLKQNGRGM
jgi:hypothetical protein